MFPFIGIQADEEPKTAISASGLYNSSNIPFPQSSLSSPLLSGLGEFSLMFWVYMDTITQTTTIYNEDGSISGISVSSTGEIKFNFESSSATNLIVESLTSLTISNWYHVCFTGSVLNNRLRVYINGALDNSAVMTYSLYATSSANLNNFADNYDISQINAYNRELSETEVAEHYVYDDDTMSSGVLGWDAMTPTQRSGLIYSSSYTNNISISGNEFNDKSGSGITISPQPSLTGQQIYFYTDASDLPSDTTVYNVNSATILGNEHYTADIAGALDFKEDWTIKQSFKVTDFNGGAWASALAIDNSTNSWIEIRVQQSPQEIRGNIYNGAIDTGTISTPLTLGEWYHVVYTNTKVGQDVDLWVNGVKVGTAVHAAPFGTLSRVVLGRTPIGRASGINYLNGYLTTPKMWSRKLTDEECIRHSSELVCYEDLPASDKVDCEYAPRISNWDTNVGGETTDQSGNGIITTPVGSPTYTDQGLTVECTS